jgi:ABC-type uncharacterized transport system permease subunit
MHLGRLLALRVRNQFLDWSGAWWFILTLTASNAAGPLIGLAVWRAVRPGSPVTTGYFVALVVVQLLTASFEQHTFAETIYDGRLGHDLLKPQPALVGPIGENIAIRCWLALAGLPLTALTAVAVDASYRLPAVLAAAPVLAGAMLLRFLWTLLLACTAFWTERVHAIVAFGNVLVFLLGGAAAPLAELSPRWRLVALALPFHAMLGLPAEVATGAAAGAAVRQQCAWAAVFVAVVAIVWRAGVRRYTSVGG